MQNGVGCNFDQFSLVKHTSRGIAGGGARTHTILRSLDFESSASANSATPALGDRSERIRDSRASSTSPRRRARCPQRILLARKDAIRRGQGTLQQIECSQTARWPENFAKNNCVAQTGRRCKQRGDVSPSVLRFSNCRRHSRVSFGVL